MTTPKPIPRTDRKQHDRGRREYEAVIQKAADAPGYVDVTSEHIGTTFVIVGSPFPKAEAGG